MDAAKPVLQSVREHAHVRVLMVVAVIVQENVLSVAKKHVMGPVNKPVAFHALVIVLSVAKVLVRQVAEDNVLITVPVHVKEGVTVCVVGVAVVPCLCSK